MGNTRKCMEQAVFLRYRGGESNAGDQSGEFIEDISGEEKGEGYGRQYQSDPASADGGDSGCERGFFSGGGGRDAGFYRPQWRGVEHYHKDADGNPLSGWRQGRGAGDRPDEKEKAACLSDRHGVRAEGTALDTLDILR